MADSPGTGGRGGAVAIGEDTEGLLAQALAHVEAALDHARKDEWEQVALRDGECRAIVDTLTTDTGERDPVQLADGLAGIRERYRELLGLAEAHRDQLAECVRRSTRGRAGARAYEENE